MRCPFCSLSINIEFRDNLWVAMRDGHEHACAGLIQARSEHTRPTIKSQPKPTTLHQTLAPRVAVAMATQAPRKAGLRSGLRRLPVQLELQALY